MNHENSAPELQPQLHPARLSIAALLFGLEPAPLRRCRILELGCGNANSLLALAQALPQAELHGFETAAEALRDGQERLQALGLGNLHLHLVVTLTELPASLGEFDYVLIADAYSRLAAPQQEALLATCRRHLAEPGVAVIGCQVLPGAALAMAVDQLLADQALPAQEADRRGLLRYLMQRGVSGAEATVEPEHLQKNRSLLLQALACRPGYFHEFARAATRHGLHCLGEADDLQESLNDILRYGWPGQTGYYLREQYRDFLLHRSFRYNLLCRRPLAVSPEILTQRLRRLHFSSPFQSHSEIPPIQFDMVLRFFDPQGSEISEDAPIAKSALWYLGKAWPRPVPFDDLLQQARQQLEERGVPPEEADFELLAARLLRHYMANSIHAFSAEPLFAVSLPDLPNAAPLARFQVSQGQNRLFNLRHESVELSPVAANLLAQLDGNRDRAALLDVLQGWVRDGWLCPRTPDGEPMIVTPDMLAELLDTVLNDLLQQGLLLSE